MGGPEEERLRALTAAAVVKVRQQANVGVMGDAFADEAFCRALAEAIGARREIATAHGRLVFRPTAAFAEIAGDGIAALPVSRQQAQSSNTLVTLGERLLLKGYRRLQRGVNPEFEIGRFLTEVAKYPNCVPLAGTLEYVGGDGATLTLALLQAYVSNQGDAWVEHARLPRPLPRGAARERRRSAGRRARRVHGADPYSRHPHRGAASRVRAARSRRRHLRPKRSPTPI